VSISHLRQWLPVVKNPEAAAKNVKTTTANAIKNAPKTATTRTHAKSNASAAIIANAATTANVKTANAIAAKKPKNANAAINAHAVKTANAKIANAKQAARNNATRHN